MYFQFHLIHVEYTHIVVMGAGAIGSLIGGWLSRAGFEVTLVGRRAHVDAIKKNGLRVSGLESFTANPEATTKPPAGDLYLLTVKAYDVSGALSALPRGDVPIVGFQNGMGNLEKVEEHAGEGLALGAVCYMGATFIGPGEVRFAGNGPVYFGLPRGGESGIARDVAKMFSSAGFEASATVDLPRMLWEKLLVNAAINPLTALTGLLNGAIAEDLRLRELMFGVIDEGLEVAKAEGISISGDIRELAVKVCRQTAENRSSMLQDMERGKRTEVDAINGYVIEKAKLYNIPVPVNRALQALVKGRERTGPG